MSTVLVTGGAGFIGSHLCERLLSLGYKVINLDNFNNSYDPDQKRRNIQDALGNPAYTLLEGDICDPGLCEKLARYPDIGFVIHLAALAGVRRSVENPLDYVDVDIRGTVNLLEFCRKGRIKKFFFASSSSVYGFNAPPFRENDALELQASPYAAAKQSGELFCRTYNHLYGIPVVCLRFFTVYGPRQRPDMAIHIFAKALLEGREITVFGDGTSSRDYTYVQDIVDGIIEAMQLRCNFEVFNLGNSTPVDIRRLIEVLSEKLGRPAKFRYETTPPGDVPATCADISKAARFLKYQPRIELEEGIEKFTAWYLGQVSGKSGPDHAIPL